MGYVTHRKVEVEAKIDNGPPVEIKWDISNTKMTFNNDKHDDYFLVTFQLDDRTGKGLKFRPVATDALWVTNYVAGAGCPPPNAQVPDIVPLFVDNSGTELTVLNKNLTEQKFYYVLRFLDSGNNPVDCDPIWDNKNGQNQSKVNVAAAITIGVIAAALITVVYLSTS